MNSPLGYSPNRGGPFFAVLFLELGLFRRCNVNIVTEGHSRRVGRREDVCWIGACHILSPDKVDSWQLKGGREKFNFLQVIVATLLHTGSWSPEDMGSSVCWINH